MLKFEKQHQLNIKLLAVVWNDCLRTFPLMKDYLLFSTGCANYVPLYVPKFENK